MMDKIREKLEACAFCGVEDGDHDEGIPFLQIEPLGSRYRVICGNCGARGGARDTPADAIKAWNERAARASEQGGEIREAPDFDHYWKIVIGWAQDMGTIKRLSVHQIRMLCERLQSITAHALLTSDSAKPAEERGPEVGE